MNNTLSLCIICKNEENNIGKLLESVKGILFDEDRILLIDDTKYKEEDIKEIILQLE